MNVSPNATRYKSTYRNHYIVPALLLLIPAAVVVGYVIKGMLG